MTIHIAQTNHNKTFDFSITLSLGHTSKTKIYINITLVYFYSRALTETKCFGKMWLSTGPEHWRRRSKKQCFPHGMPHTHVCWASKSLPDDRSVSFCQARYALKALAKEEDLTPRASFEQKTGCGRECLHSWKQSRYRKANTI